MQHWLANTGFWKDYVSAASVIGGFATAFALAVGAFSLVLIGIQIVRTSRISREVIALNAHKYYMLLCFQHPELSSSYMMSKHLKARDFSIIFENVKPSQERALWFVSYVLFTMDQILVAKTAWGRTDRIWLNLVAAQLNYHRSLLIAAWPYWKDMYNPRMKRLVREVMHGKHPMEGFDIGAMWSPPPARTTSARAGAV